MKRQSRRIVGAGSRNDTTDRGYWNPVDIRESFLSLDLFSLKLKNIVWPVTGAIAPPYGPVTDLNKSGITY